MTRLIVRGVLGRLVGIVLAGCVAVPAPVAEPFRSPLRGPAVHQVFLPHLTWDGHFGKGLAVTYNSAGIDACADAHVLGAGWLYSWNSTPPQCNDVVSLPMIFSWDSLSDCPVLPPAPLTLLFNEPSSATQANISPVDAAGLIYHLVEECEPRVWASPGQISTDTFDGLVWMTETWDAYRAKFGHWPPIPVMAIHCYTWQGRAQVCIDRLQAALDWTAAHDMRGVLVTEVAILPCYVGIEVAVIENDKLYTWVMDQPRVLGYAHFAQLVRGDEVWAIKPATCNTSLFDWKTRELSPFGVWYRDVP